MRNLSLIIIIAFSVLSLNVQAEKIQDNSFLIEEAYNQEAGVVQHIGVFNFSPDEDLWAATFTQEWPVLSQDHQFSYTIPFEKAEAETGISDIFLNYRYQAVSEGNVAFAPRLSLILPSGESKEGLGSDSLGYQVNLPLSVELTKKLVAHWNLGVTFLPDAKSFDSAEANNTSVNFGTSLVYLASPNLNFLLEIVGASDEITIANNATEREDSFVVNPGLRYAFNFDSGLQIVPGMSVPIGIGASEGEYGLLGYLSFEHGF